MALALLCLGLTLLGALQTQAQDSAPSFLPAPSLAKIPIEPDFQDDKFQGKWYVLGLAGNEFLNKTYIGIKLHSATYKLEADQSYNVTSTLFSDKGCQNWIGNLVPGFRPGQYNLSNIQYLPNLRSYNMQVVATDYSEYAILFFMKTFGNTEFFNIRLYGRTKELHPILKKFFVLIAKFLGLTDGHIIFPDPNDNCIDD